MDADCLGQRIKDETPGGIRLRIERALSRTWGHAVRFGVV